MIVEKTRRGVERMPQDKSGEFHGLDERLQTLELGRWGDDGQHVQLQKSWVESKVVKWSNT